MDLKRFAICLKRAIGTKAARGALRKGLTWTAGGCWTLAHAVAGLVDGELWALVTEDEDGREVVQHVVVQVGSHYLDGDGLSSEERLLDRWNTDEGLSDAQLYPFTEGLQAVAMRQSTRCDTRVATTILPALMKCARRR